MRKSNYFSQRQLLPFSLSAAHWIGFDLDHTLVRYKVPALHALCRSTCVEFLRTRHESGALARAYDALSLRTIAARYDANEQPLHDANEQPLPPRFMLHVNQRVVLDLRRGTVLKLDERAHVCVAFKGFRRLPADAYAAAPLAEFNGLLDERYWPLVTFFESWLAEVYMELIEALGDDAADGGDVLRELAADLYASLYYAFGDFDRGAFFEAFRARPMDYVYTRPFFAEWAARVRREHPETRIFLMTNSLTPFARLLLRATLGGDSGDAADLSFRRYFDLIVYHARKPHFFIAAADAPFKSVDGRTLTHIDDVARRVTDGGAVEVEGGNVRDLHRYFVDDAARRRRDVADCSVVYAGDHLIADVFLPPHYSNWRTIAVVEELAALERLAGVPEAARFDAVLSPRPPSAAAAAHAEAAARVTSRAALDALSDDERAAFGSPFFTDDGRLTYIARLLIESATLYCSDVRHLLSGALAHEHVYSHDHASQLTLAPSIAPSPSETLRFPTPAESRLADRHLHVIVAELQKNK